ncbi:MAG: hypothetical protein HPY65_18535 [Syntrophaceae bacterium]|nr:hypothetical protein [Syntrophaceae bacterium]
MEKILNESVDAAPGESGRPPVALTGRGGGWKARTTFLRTRLFFFLMILFLAGCASAPDRLAMDPAAAWPGRCETVRRSLLKEPSAGVVVTPRPDRSYSIPYWVIVVDGVPIPIPPVRYRDIHITPASFSGGLPTVILVGAEPPTAVTLASISPPAPYEDIFALAGEEPTKEGRVLTMRLFGGPVAHDRLMEIGFAGRPADLTCRPDRWEKEIALASALVLKTVGNPLEAVHEGIAGRRGWVTLSAGADRTNLWQTTLPGTGRWILIDIRAAAGGPFQDVGLAVGRADMVRAMGRPPWLAALAAVLDDPENGKLREVLADALEKAQFTPESVERVRSPATGVTR